MKFSFFSTLFPLKQTGLGIESAIGLSNPNCRPIEGTRWLQPKRASHPFTPDNAWSPHTPFRSGNIVFHQSQQIWTPLKELEFLDIFSKNFVDWKYLINFCSNYFYIAPSEFSAENFCIWFSYANAQNTYCTFGFISIYLLK